MVLLTVFSLLLGTGYASPAARAQNIGQIESVEPCSLVVNKINSAEVQVNGFWAVIQIYTTNAPCTYDFTVFYDGDFDAFGTDVFTCQLDSQRMWGCKGTATRNGQVGAGVLLNDTYPKTARYSAAGTVQEWEFRGHAIYVPIAR